jgi:hypothetical protein
MTPTPLLEIDLVTFAVGGVIVTLLLMVILPAMERWRIDIRVTIEPTELIARPEPPQLSEKTGETAQLARRGRW